LQMPPARELSGGVSVAAIATAAKVGG